VSNNIQIEPDDVYRYAIVRRSPVGLLTYNYYLLARFASKHLAMSTGATYEYVDKKFVTLDGNGLKICYSKKPKPVFKQVA